MGTGLSPGGTPGHNGSFNVVSIFARMLIMEAISLLCRHSEDILRLFHHVLTSYFSFISQLYEQTNGVVIGSPLSPVIAKFFMEDFEVLLDQAVHKPPASSVMWMILSSSGPMVPTG
jgi:hypothetical protein